MEKNYINSFLSDKDRYEKIYNNARFVVRTVFERYNVLDKIPAEEIDDLVSDVITTALENSARYNQGMARPGTWINRMTFNASIDFLRGFHKGCSLDRGYETPEGIFVPFINPVADVDIKAEVENREMLFKCDSYVESHFSKVDRDVYSLTKEGLKSQDIGNLLGLPSNTVSKKKLINKTRLAAAL